MKRLFVVSLGALLCLNVSYPMSRYFAPKKFTRYCPSIIWSAVPRHRALYHHEHAPLDKVSLFSCYAQAPEEIEAILTTTDPLFNAVAGYNCVKNNIYRSLESSSLYTAKGYVYELQVAVDLMLRENQTIVAFEKRYTHPHLHFTREIDIITDSCAIECKCITWQSLQRSAYISAKLVSQLMEQHELVRSGVVGVPYFMIYSKNAIPFDWKVWLSQKGILYAEGPA